MIRDNHAHRGPRSIHDVVPQTDGELVRAGIGVKALPLMTLRELPLFCHVEVVVFQGNNWVIISAGLLNMAKG